MVAQPVTTNQRALRPVSGTVAPWFVDAEIEIVARRAFAAAEPQQHCAASFPYHVISGVAGEFAELYSNCVEPPIEFFYMSFLTIFGATVAHRLTLQTEIRAQP